MNSHQCFRGMPKRSICFEVSKGVAESAPGDELERRRGDKFQNIEHLTLGFADTGREHILELN